MRLSTPDSYVNTRRSRRKGGRKIKKSYLSQKKSLLISPDLRNLFTCLKARGEKDKGVTGRAQKRKKQTDNFSCAFAKGGKNRRGRE